MSSVISQLFSQRELESLQTDAPTPLYHQMFTLLKSRILNGSIAHGTQMPTEQQLAEAFDVSRITAKRAMDELAAAELVERRRGKGTHVTHHYSPDPLQAPLVGMLEKLASMSRKTKVKVLDIAKIAPPSDIQVDMQLASDAKVHRVIRVRNSEDGLAFAHHVSWTKGIKNGFTKRQLETRVRMDILKENDINVQKIEQYLGATAASDDIAELLDMSAGEPVLTLTRRAYDENDCLVDILFCQYNPKRFQYRMSMTMDEFSS